MLVELERDKLDYRLEHIFSFTITIANLEVIGILPEGLRANAYVTGGEVSGPKVCGKARPVGGDWATLRTDGVSNIDYRLTFETHDGALLYVAFTGVCDFGEDGYQKMHPVGRFAKPEEIAEAVVWLCSDRASFMTGQSLTVDGGYTTQ